MGLMVDDYLFKGACSMCRQIVPLYKVVSGYYKTTPHRNANAGACSGSNCVPTSVVKELIQKTPVEVIPGHTQKKTIQVLFPNDFLYTLVLSHKGDFNLRYRTSSGEVITTGPGESTFRSAINRLVVFHKDRFYAGIVR